MNVIEQPKGRKRKSRIRGRIHRVGELLDRTTKKRIKSQALHHAADVEIWVYGATYKRLFENNLKAMNNILKEGFGDTADHFDCLMRLTVTSADPTNLLVDFLSEVLSLTYVQKAIFGNTYFSELSNNKIDAQLYGRWIDGCDEEIKGIPYERAYVKRKEDGTWESHIIFDI